MEKICCSCRKEKSLDDFHNNKRTKDGKQTTCKACNIAYSIGYRKHTEKGRKSSSSYNKQYYYDNVQGTDKYKESTEKCVKERRISGKAAAYLKNKRLTDPSFKIRENITSRILQAIRTNSKGAHTLDLVGCTIEFLKAHLESQFTEGMSWDNYGKKKTDWNIDHIVPCNGFNLSCLKQQQTCFHWRNLQPLWWEDNHKKSGKIPTSI